MSASIRRSACRTSWSLVPLDELRGDGSREHREEADSDDHDERHEFAHGPRPASSPLDVAAVDPRLTAASRVAVAPIRSLEQRCGRRQARRDAAHHHAQAYVHRERSLSLSVRKTRRGDTPTEGFRVRLARGLANRDERSERF
jgi:hypothetical protein